MHHPLTLALSLSFLASPTTAQQLHFEEVSQAVGINATLSNHLVHPAGPMNGGGSVADLNNDGITDLFLPSYGVHPDRIFYGKVDGFFHEQTPIVRNATALYFGVGSSVGDFDNDGWEDIYVTSFGDLPGTPGIGANRLYHNNGDGTFTDVAAFAGVSFDSASIPDGYGSCFGDYDLDGDLDLFVCGWEANSQGNRLYRNEGNGTFSDQTVAAGIPSISIRGFSPRFADLDGDRYPELLVAADFGTSAIFHNNQDGVFRNRTLQLKPDKVHFGMGQALGDFDGNGFLDWYVTSIFFDSPQSFTPNGNRLYLNQGKYQPMRATPFSSGVVNGGWGWGAVAGDFDLDGDLDLAEVNGWPDPEWHDESCYLFLNNGSANFTESGFATGFSDSNQGRGLLRFDYQNDGDLDLIVLNNNGPVLLFRNDLSGVNKHFLRVDVDTSLNPSLAPGGFGTRVTAEYSGRKHVQYLDGGSNYLGCSQRTAHFGLNAALSVDRLTISWSDGFTTVLEDLSADQRLNIVAPKPLTQDSDLHLGDHFTSTLSGIKAGEDAWFLLSTAGGAPIGPTIPLLGNLHLNLLRPILPLGRATADAHGVATLNSHIATWLPLGSIATQAVVSRGIDGSDSIKSNVVLRTILP